MRASRATNSLVLNLRNKLLSTGRFLTLLPSHALMPSGKHPSVKALPVELPNRIPGMIAIITLRNKTLSPLSELFIRNTRAVAKPLARAR